MELLKKLLFEIKFASAFLFVKNKNFYGLSRIFTILSITVSVTAFLLTLTTFRGYLKVLEERYLDVNSHIVVNDGFSFYDDIKTEISTSFHKDIEDIKYTGYMELLLRSNNRMKGIIVELVEKGSFKNLVNISKYLTSGKLDCVFENNKNIILSNLVAKNLGIKKGDTVDLVFIGKSIGSKAVKLKLCATVDFGLYDLDSRFSYMSLYSVKEHFPAGMYNASVKINIKDETKLNKIVEDLREQYSPTLKIRSWRELNYSMFESIKFDKMVVSFILMILVAVAAFNIISTLILSIQYLKKDFSILSILGLNNTRLLRILFFEASIIGVLSYILAIILWLISMLAVFYFGIIDLPSDIYLVSKIPFDISSLDLFFVFAIVYLFVSIASIFPMFILLKNLQKRGFVNAIKN